MGYTGFDKIADAKIPATERLIDLCGRRWKFTNMGSLVVRVMRSAPADIQKLDVHDPKCKPYMSVHATGRAADIGFGADDKAAVQAMNWFVQYADQLGIEEVHDYGGRTKPGTSQWGRGWRVGRGWKDWTATDNGGTPGLGTKWIHVEISPAMAAKSADEYEAIWRSVPKP
jgi:hypothetical protein